MKKAKNKETTFRYQRPKGMRDLLPPLTTFWQKIEQKSQKYLEQRGFQRIETPILEKAELYSKGIGEATDIVEKEMYILKTSGGDRLALRPEYTAGVCRAYLELGMTVWPKPVKLWYMGPVFRHEKPQALRWREFWQLGFEIIGEDHPILDAQTVLWTKELLSLWGLKETKIVINSLGDEKCRPKYLTELSSYLKANQKSLCENCKKRLKKNPLRVLDCKEEKCQIIISQAPSLPDFLCKECKTHFTETLEYLESWGVSFELQPTLVRGLDYYSRTVFEILPNQEKGTSVAGGGRYDYLIERLGGERTPAVGMAIGIDRVAELVKLPSGETKYHLFLAHLGKKAQKRAAELSELLRKEGFVVAELLSRSSLRSQLQRANRLGIRYVLLLGQKEVAEKTIILKDLQEKTQEILPQQKLVKYLKKIIR